MDYIIIIIDEISSKAKKIVGLKFFIVSFLCTHLLKYSFVCACQALVKQYLQYTSQIRNPHLIKHINQLEVIQKFALKICFKSWSNFGYLNLHYSNLPSLADRRRFLNLCYFGKLSNHAIDFPKSPLTSHTLVNYPKRQGRTSL